MKKEFQREIKSPFSYQFETSEDGLYSLTIKASCQPGWRNKWWLWFKGLLEDILDLHLDDEDLRVEIDGQVFKKPKGKKGLFNSPAAFSGTKMLGKTKTVVFVMHLNKGSHTIKFIPNGSPYLESLEIEKVNDPQKFILYLNTQAEDDKERLRKAIAAYNTGPRRVPVKRTLDLSSYDEQTKRLVNCVENRLKPETFKKIISAAKVFGLIFFISLTLSVGYGVQSLQQETALGRSSLDRLMVDRDNNGIVEEIFFKSVDDGYQGWNTKIIYQGNSVEMDGSLLTHTTIDVDNDSSKELVIKTTVGANGVVARVYKLTSQGLAPIPLQPDPTPEGFFGDTSFVDYDHDGDLDAKVRIRVYPPDPCKETFELYTYNSGVFELTQGLSVDEADCRNAVRKFRG